MQTLMLVVALAIAAFDFQNILAWWRGKTIEPGDEESHDFTIVVPLFGHPRYFETAARFSATRQTCWSAWRWSPG